MSQPPRSAIAAVVSLALASAVVWGAACEDSDGGAGGGSTDAAAPATDADTGPPLEGEGEDEGEGEGEGPAGPPLLTGCEPGRQPRAGEVGDSLELLDSQTLRQHFVETIDGELVDGVLYICTNESGLLAFDASDPANPVSADPPYFPFPDSFSPHCQHIAVGPRKRVYISNRGDQLGPEPFIATYLVNSHDVGRFLGVRYLPDTPVEGMAIVGKHLFAAAHERGLVALELLDDGDVREVGHAEGLTNSWHVAIQGDLAYVADGAGGLAIVDISDPTAPLWLGGVPTGGNAVDVAVSGDHAYLAQGAAGMAIVDVSQPSAPSVVSVVDTPGAVAALNYVNGHVILADWADLRVLDVRDPANPLAVLAETVPVVERPGAPQGAPPIGFSRVLGVTSEADTVVAIEWYGPVIYRLHPDRSQADIQAVTPEFIFPKIEPGEQVARSVILANGGDRPLNLFEVRVPEADGFEVAGLPATIEPCERDYFEILFTAPDVGEQSITGEAVVVSDDPDEPELAIRLYANIRGRGVGDQALGGAFRDLDGVEVDLRAIEGPYMLAYFATF